MLDDKYFSNRLLEMPLSGLVSIGQYYIYFFYLITIPILVVINIYWDNILGYVCNKLQGLLIMKIYYHP